MTSLKTVLLGSAASLLAVGVAQAADLPVKKAAAAVQYVEVCPVYGSGFYKLPGTDICMRHFGSVKFNAGFQDERTHYDVGGPARVRDGASNTTGWQWTIRPGWDFRSPTEYGTLRTVVQMRVDQRNGIFQDNDPELTGAMRTTNLIHRGYIEWAGFLIGRAGSQYPYWDQDDVVTAVGGDPKTTAMQVTYVFSAPGGLKATIGLEDSTPWIAGDGVTDLTTLIPNGGVNPGPNAFGPQRFYDVVASISTEQSWGNAKLAAGLHRIQTYGNVFGGAGSANDVEENEYGFGLLGGITFNLPMLGAKDQLLLQATYCDGAIAYCGINGGADNNTTSFERSGQYLDGLQRDDVDAYAVNNGTATSWDFEKTKVWTVAAQLRHYWAPLWRSNLSASYRDINVPNIAARSTLGGRPGTGVGDATAFDVALNLIWGQSRRTAEIGIEAVYKSVDQDIDNRNFDVILPGARRGVDRNPDGWAVVGFISRAW